MGNPNLSGHQFRDVHHLTAAEAKAASYRNTIRGGITRPDAAAHVKGSFDYVPSRLGSMN